MKILTISGKLLKRNDNFIGRDYTPSGTISFIDDTHAKFSQHSAYGEVGTVIDLPGITYDQNYMFDKFTTVNTQVTGNKVTINKDSSVKVNSKEKPVVYTIDLLSDDKLTWSKNKITGYKNETVSLPTLNHKDFYRLSGYKTTGCVINNNTVTLTSNGTISANSKLNDDRTVGSGYFWNVNLPTTAWGGGYCKSFTAECCLVCGGNYFDGCYKTDSSTITGIDNQYNEKYNYSRESSRILDISKAGMVLLDCHAGAIDPNSGRLFGRNPSARLIEKDSKKVLIEGTYYKNPTVNEVERMYVQGSCVLTAQPILYLSAAKNNLGVYPYSCPMSTNYWTATAIKP